MTVNDEKGHNLTSGKHISYWTDSVPPLFTNPLKENLRTDVVIVGGGIGGLSVAYSLIQTGKKVVLVEDGFIASGETGRTTAHLVTALDDRYYDLEKIFGEPKTKLIAESHKIAIDFIESIVKKENIDCNFERLNGYLFLHSSGRKDMLQKEYEATVRSGIEINKIDAVPGLSKTEYGLQFPNQAQFHPLKYLKGLAKVIEREGGRIFTGTHASKIDHEGITTEEGFIVKANHVVVATNNPVNNIFTIPMKEYAYRTYVIGALVKKGVLPKALWWDTGDVNISNNLPPYHYVRMHPYDEHYDLLVSGGEDHPIGDISTTQVKEENRYKLIEDWTRNYFPIENIIYRWSGQILEPMDGLAYIGRNPFDHDNVYIVTGDSGNGITHCSFAGLLIADLINGKENKWEKIYSPSRFTIKKSGSIFKQMMHEFASYMKQTPNFKNSKELASIKNGEGRIVDMLEEKFGVYRNKDGNLYIVSAQCTHLKCTLKWNNDELSWDCPCHGSRFTYEGKVMNGPANLNLSFYSEKEDLVNSK